MPYKPPPTIPCQHCGKPTHMLGTKLCDGCWETERAVLANPELARKLLKESDECPKT